MCIYNSSRDVTSFAAIFLLIISYSKFCECMNSLCLLLCGNTHVCCKWSVYFAVSSMDYVTLAEIMMFDVCETQRCVNVTILNDSVDEPEETFRVTLERTPDLDNRITLEPVDGEIVIVDNDGKYTFYATYYNYARRNKFSCY